MGSRVPWRGSRFPSTLSLFSNLFGASVQGVADFRLFRPGDDLYVGVDFVGREVSRVYVAPELSPALLALGGVLAGGAVALRRRSRAQSFLVR